MKKSWLILFSLLHLFCQAQKFSAFDILNNDKDSFGIVEIRKTGFKLISPLLDCYTITDPGLKTIKIMKQQVTDYISSVKASGLSDHISVYYRDLSNGPWLGIDEKELYSPASLLKVPVLIAAMNYAQAHPGFLQTKIVYMASGDIPQNITTGQFLVPGQTYSVRQLLEYMIISSDNEAKNILTQMVPNDLIKEVFYDLGINLQKESPADEFLSVKEYAGFFRILYNASYLSKEASEYALSILAESTYKKGIVAGLPGSINVAHKFGERYYSDTNIKQLHDCGIVYLDKHPYLLCVMTRGTEFTDLQDIISNISRIVYNVLKTAD